MWRKWAGMESDGSGFSLWRLRWRGACRASAARLDDVVLVDCMQVCGRPVAVAFRGAGKAAYLFAGVDPVAQVEEIVVFAGLYAAAKDGIIADARPCGQLRLCLVGRIPA